MGYEDIFNKKNNNTITKNNGMRIKRGEMVKIIFKTILRTGEIAITALEPRSNTTLRCELSRYDKCENKRGEKDRKFYNAFYYLKRNGLIHMEYRGQQMYVSLTKEGKRKAGKYQIDDLEIKKPKKWDGQWRVLIFDIADKQRIKREALRGKIKELGLFQLQKSVWVYPYDFKKEMALLREFFGLTDCEMKIIEASKIENDSSIREFFRLN